MKTTPRRCLFLLGFAVFLAVRIHGQEIALATQEGGIVVQTGLSAGNHDGRFIIEPPGLIMGDDVYHPLPPKLESSEEGVLVFVYGNGAKVQAAIAESRVNYSFSGIPAGATALTARFIIPHDYWQGGRFAVDGGAPREFPETKDKEILYEGEAEKFVLADASGTALQVEASGLRQRLVQNEGQGWTNYIYYFNFVFAAHPGQAEYTLALEGSALSP